jgi:2-C-methyl-D-erythritol 4-phosphate cytidylyltransferase
MKKFALIVAGGSGSRMGKETPKQFLELNGRPLLMHTIEVFIRYDVETEVILVLPEKQIKVWKELCGNHNFKIDCKIVFGGENRFQSVRNGLELISSDGIVFIHDGVRPLVSVQTIRNCFDMAAIRGNALPVISVSESVRFIESGGNRAVDRSKYVLVQTPQTFKTGLIQRAYMQTVHENYTDDASVLENMGESIQLVEGNRENLKITFPEDLIIAEILLNKGFVK